VVEDHLYRSSPSAILASLAAGARVGGDSWAGKARSAESVAEAIVGVIQSGDEEILLTQGGNPGGPDPRDTGQAQ
jgi:hypothetical protein